MNPPENIGKYRVELVLGTGTFATVYLAYDPDLDTRCAVKVLAEQWSQDKSARAWFLNEARWMFGIDHLSILRVYTSGTTESGRPFFVMEYADRGNLADYMRQRWMQGRGFSLNEALDISLKIAEGLVVAHSHGIAHRDLKPRNILLRSQPAWGFRAPSTDQEEAAFEIKLADFGLARKLESGTHSLAGAGTPLYMAPEQLKAALEDHPDPRSDVYAAATILYELLAGRVPFPYQAPGQIISAHLTEEPMPIRSLRPNLPKQVADLVHQGLRKDPNQRFASALAWKNALRQLRELTSGEETQSAGAVASDQPDSPEDTEPNQATFDPDHVPTEEVTALADGESGPLYIETTRINDAPTAVVTPQDDDWRGYRARSFDPARPASLPLPRWTVYLGGIAGLLGIIGLISLILLGLPDDGQSPSESNVAAVATPTPEPEATATPMPEPSPTPDPMPTVAPTETPTPTPDATGSGPEVEPEIRQSLEGLPGLSSSLVILPAGERVGHSADRRVPSASIIKLWIAGAGYEEAAFGNVDLDDLITVNEADQVSGTGILHRAEYAGRELRFSDLLEIMLLYSDNTAANIVTREIGGTDRVNEYAAEHGYQSTQMQRMLGELDPNRENYTSAADTGLFLERLLNDEIVDPIVSARIRDILQRRHANENDQLNFFGRELRSTMTYAHISGILPNVRNDAGYFLKDDGEPVIVVALLDNLPSEEVGMEAIGRAVGEVYEQVE